ncbi:MAG: hypothetical protein KDK56_01545 [Simkania sp.]|nr:hypothetical protein [Simkania sp.]MCB1074553.1 hypothetical protein [Simkania sp.]MCP5490051.1 hypothetical protein [Chlamydiales bacterium]
MKRAISFIGAIIIGTLLAYVWSCLSWTVFPFHEWTLKTFTNTETVAQVITQNAPESGVYMIPSCEHHQDTARGPLVLSAVRLQGINPNMVKEIIIHLITLLISTTFIATLLQSLASSLKYVQKIGVIVCIALIGAILNQTPLWNWHFFSPSFVLMGIVDQVVMYFIAGIGMAGLIKAS